MAAAVLAVVSHRHGRLNDPGQRTRLSRLGQRRRRRRWGHRTVAQDVQAQLALQLVQLVVAAVRLGTLDRLIKRNGPKKIEQQVRKKELLEAFAVGTLHNTTQCGSSCQ
jgi:hypothetical protein